MVFRKIIMLAILSAAPVVAMEKQGSNKRNDQSQSGDLKKRDEKVAVKSLIKAAPTWQEIVCAFYQGTLTSEIASAYIMERLRARIAYWQLQKQDWTKRWKKKIEKGEGAFEAMKAAEKIPLYIMYARGEVRAEDMFEKAMLYSDKKAREFHESVCKNAKDFNINVDSWENSMCAQGFVITSFGDRKCVMFLRDFIHSLPQQLDLLQPFEFLKNIEHELSHIEQSQNLACLAVHRKIHNMSDMYQNLGLVLTDRTACSLFMNFKSHNNEQERVDVEVEAEYKSLLFHPAQVGMRHCFSQYLKIRKDLGVRMEPSINEQGYFGPEFCLKILDHFKFSQQEKEEYKKVFEINQKFGKCDHSKKQEMYKKSLNKQ